MEYLKELQRKRQLVQKINASSQAKQIWGIIANLKKLQGMGKKPWELEEVIKQMDLPLNLHLFITGNFSHLMGLEVKSA